MQKILIKKNFVDADSGEILKTTESSVKNLFDVNKGYFFGNQVGAKRYLKNKFPENISDGEAGKLLKLFFNVEPNTNLLVFRSGNVNKAMQKENIAKRLGMSVRSCSRFLNKMVKLNVMAKVVVEKNNISKKEDNYFFNPVYFFAGNWLRYNLYVLFKKDLDGLLPRWVISKFMS